MGVGIGEKERLFCRLVTFAEDECHISSTAKDISETYSSEVLGRFRERMGVPDAALVIMPNFDGMPTEMKRKAATALDEAKKQCGYNYVQQGLDGRWEFSIGTPEMISVAVLTNGDIEVDWATAEDIFNFVSD